MRYRLRTLLIVMTLAPPLITGAWYGWQRIQHERQQWQSLDRMLRD